MSFSRGKNNPNANTRLVLYYFTISFVVFNIFNRFSSTSVIWMIWLANIPHKNSSAMVQDVRSLLEFSSLIGRKAANYWRYEFLFSMVFE
jgi:hypothetical protein